MEKQNPKYYQLSLGKHCLCGNCDALGCHQIPEKNSSELKVSLEKAKSGNYDGFFLAGEPLAAPLFKEFLQLANSANFKIALQINPQTVHLYSTELEYAHEHDCELNFYMSQNGDFNSVREILKHKNLNFFYLTIIGSKTLKLDEMLASIPTELHSEIYFYFPLKLGISSPYLDCTQIKDCIVEINKKFPSLEVRPPFAIDVFEPRIQSDRNLEPIIPANLLRRTRRRAIEISVIIPSYNNRDYLYNTIAHLYAQNLEKDRFEIIIVDDGSNDDTNQLINEFVSAQDQDFNISYVYFPRQKVRKMGDSQFRAGVARNLGVKHSRGNHFLFLDSDILTPKNYLSDLLEKHKKYDVIQARRKQLKKEVSNRYTQIESIDLSRDTYITDDGWWEDFYQAKNWMDVPNKWRYVCTHSLSMSRDTFFQIGRIRKNYTFYGYEDTEIGYDLHRYGKTFHLNENNVFHLDHRTDRSEFKKSHYKKRLLLKNSAQTLYHNTLDPEVFQHLSWLFHKFLPVRIFLADRARNLGIDPTRARSKGLEATKL